MGKLRSDLALVGAAALGLLAAVLQRAWADRAEIRVEQQVRRKYGSDDPLFARTLSVLFGPTVLAGNSLDTYVNGCRIFPAMLDAIRKAERSITFETFIYWSGKVGSQFAEALIERRQAGVPVHVLLDWVGSKPMDQSLLRRMDACGVEIVRFHPPRWGALTRMNNRTHRKLLVVDGRIGFTGGVGIADEWDGDADHPDHWRDTHYRIEGPAVAQIQSAFINNWLKARGELLHGERYFPELSRCGESSAQMFSSSPAGGSESAHLMVNYALVAATRSIRISTAYFVPDELTIDTLIRAAKRGVQIDILVPSHNNDSEVARRASQYSWGRLLKAGIRIHTYMPCRLHWKVLIIDDWWVSVGSANFDNRSFSLNDEANLNVYDRDFAGEQIRQFDAELAVSTEIRLEAWQNRPRTQRIAESTTNLLGSQL
jgi:cardiolipin synthase A/B